MKRVRPVFAPLFLSVLLALGLTIALAQPPGPDTAYLLPQPSPGWDESVPWDGGCGDCCDEGPCGGPSKGDPVNLADGTETYTPAPDLVAYNPYGPPVAYQRTFYTGFSASYGNPDYASPGLSLGWLDNYDYLINADSGWTKGRLIYPNGAIDSDFHPALDGNGHPTGSFDHPAGVPYRMTGVAGAQSGWQSLTLTFRDRTTWTFSPVAGTENYALSRITPNVGKALVIDRNADRSLLRIKAETSPGVYYTVLTFTYASGKLTQIADAAGANQRKVVFTYDGSSRLWKASQVGLASGGTPADRSIYTYTRPANRTYDCLSTISVPSPTGAGNSTATLSYDSDGRVAWLQDANLNKRVYTYNSSSSTSVQIKNSSGLVVKSWTQKLNSRRNGGITDTSGSTTVAYTDASNPKRPTSVTDQSNRVTSYTYDQYGNVLTVTVPSGTGTGTTTTTYTYDYGTFALGRLLSVQEGTKTATSFTYYEPSGLVNVVTSPGPSGSGYTTVTTSHTYTTLGQIATVVRPGNNAASSITTAYNYTTDGGYSQAEAWGQPLTVQVGTGPKAHYRYTDGRGNVTSVWDDLSYRTDTTYNLANQPLQTTFPPTQTGGTRDYSVNAYLYPGGPLQSTTLYNSGGSQQRQVTYTYGPEGELLTVGGGTEPVTYTYDAAYHVKTLKDGLNQQTTYTYDSNTGRLQSIQFPGYTASPRKDIVEFTYKPDGQLDTRVDGLSSPVTATYSYYPSGLLSGVSYSSGGSVSYSYDSYNRRTSMTDGTGTTSYAYDDLNDVTSVTTTYSGLPARTVAYAYYANGSRKTMTVTAQYTYTTTYYYDALGRPSSLVNPYNETSSWSYGTNGWLSRQTLHNGAYTAYSYSPRGLLEKLQNRKSDNSVVSDFTGASGGNIPYDSAGNRTGMTITGNLPGSSTYGYTTKDELAADVTSRTSSYSHLFSYDGAGNPTRYRGVSGLTYNSDNQRTDAGYVYNGNGSPTSYKGYTLSYDAENRLTAYGSLLTAGYTGDGLRAWKQNSGGVRTYFLYDGAVPVLEMNASGNTTAVNTFGPTGLLSRIVSSTVYYVFDPQGSVASRLNGSQTVLSSDQYDAYGNRWQGDTTDVFAYGAQTGYYRDTETGLYLCTFRYYDARDGRFLSRDPLGYSGGVNLYGYVAGNPLRRRDPLGLAWLSGSDNNMKLFLDWLIERRSSFFFGPKDPLTTEFRRCQGAGYMRSLFASGGYRDIPKGAWSTLAAGLAAPHDVVYSPIGFFTGGFEFRVRNNGNGTATYMVKNATSIESFFYHFLYLPVPHCIKHKTQGRGGHMMGDMYMYFSWTEPLPPKPNEGGLDGWFTPTQ